MTPTRTPLLALLTVLALSVVGCGSDGSGGGSSEGSVALVAYTTPKEAYDEVVPAFTKTAAGKGIGFSQSYGASGDQARAVIAGLDADVVALSLEPDVRKLVDEELVAPGWDAGPLKGMVTRSVVVLAVREGNPKNIRGWSDLLKDGLEVLTPNPFTSGGARWNVMAAYGSQIQQGRTEAQAIDYLEALFKQVAVQDKSAREALQTFAGGKGDVLISYENEAITAQQKGQDIDYVIPDETILIENPIAVTKNAPAAARAFVAYAQSEPAQRIFAEKGYRPVIDGAVRSTRFTQPSGLFDIAKFGGWKPVMKKFFDPKGSVMSEIEESLGVDTG